MTTSTDGTAPRIAVVGAGPAGLMAAEVLAAGGVQVDLFDAMPSVGRKFLLAGKGGLNLTHSEPLDAFTGRYGARAPEIGAMLARFGPAELRHWAQGLGVNTFIGSSGRVFPTDLKAAPLLRAWLHRLRAAGVRFHMRHRWVGWGDVETTEGSPLHHLRFATPHGEIPHAADAVVLATGGYGNVFYLSTNAMACNVTAAWRAHRRGAYFANPCYTQIHPTCIPLSLIHI